jgi:hypothetical protein
MARTQTMVQLTTELVASLDQEARRQGVSRSALVRQAVEMMLASNHHRDLGRSIVEGYQRTPPLIPDAWGRLDDVGDAATAEVLWRLDEEERRKGGGWS